MVAFERRVDRNQPDLPVRTLAEARAFVHAQFGPAVTRERAPLLAARGRILAADVVAALDLPPYDNSAVDGFTFSGADLLPSGPTRLRLVGRVAAGQQFTGNVARGDAARIFTGAAMPAGCDTVVMQEYCSADGATVTIPATARRLRGEDVRAGSTVLWGGHRLRAHDIGLAAALGFHELSVFSRLRVALVSTGGEVREPGTVLQPGEIWDANRWLLRGMLESMGCEVVDLGILPDSRPAIEIALAAAAADHDLIVTSGGMSVGAEDHVGSVIRRRGSLELWRLAIKPGKPVGLGDIDTCPILALPGNPVAAIVAFVAFGRLIVARLAGGRDDAPPSFQLPAAFGCEKKPGRREYLFGMVPQGDGAVSVVKRFEKQGAAMLSAATATQGLIVLCEEADRVRPGDVVEFIPFESFLG